MMVIEILKIRVIRYYWKISLVSHTMFRLLCLEVCIVEQSMFKDYAIYA